MKLDILSQCFAMPCDVHELSPVKFYSDGKRCNRFKIGTITPSVSAGKCGQCVATILSAIICVGRARDAQRGAQPSLFFDNIMNIETS